MRGSGALSSLGPLQMGGARCWPPTLPTGKGAEKFGASPGERYRDRVWDPIPHPHLCFPGCQHHLLPRDCLTS